MELKLFLREGYLEEETEEEECRNTDNDEDIIIRNDASIGNEKGREDIGSKENYHRRNSNSEVTSAIAQPLNKPMNRRHRSLPNFKTTKSVTFDESVVFRKYSSTNHLKKACKRKFFWRIESSPRISAEI